MLSLACNGHGHDLVEMEASIRQFRSLQGCIISGNHCGPLSWAALHTISLGSWPHLEVLHLDVSHPGLGSKELRGLLGAPALRRVTLRLFRRAITLDMGEVLGSLRSLQHLVELRLLMAGSQPQPGALPAALGAVRAPQLRKLVLDLCGAEFLMHDARCLELLQHCAAHLQDLSLSLWGVGVHDGLSTSVGRVVADMPRLRSVFLDLGGNSITEAGVEQVVPTAQGRTSLCTVRMGMQGCLISVRGACTLLRLAELPGLISLTLFLGYCQLGDLGVAALSGLQNCPALRHLEVDLRGNDIHDAGADSIVDWLRATVTLRTVALYLSGNSITEAGVGRLWACLSVLNGYTFDLRQPSMGLPEVHGATVFLS